MVRAFLTMAPFDGPSLGFIAAINWFLFKILYTAKGTLFKQRYSVCPFTWVEWRRKRESVKPVLDRTKLSGLKALIGEAKYEAAIQRFKGELHACILAIAENSPDSAEHAHNLAGVTGLLGFDELAGASRRFLAARHGDTDDADPSTELLLQAAQRAEDALGAQEN